MKLLIKIDAIASMDTIYIFCLSMDNLVVGQFNSICCEFRFDGCLTRLRIDFLQIIYCISYINTPFWSYKLIPNIALLKNNNCAVNIICKRYFKRYVNPSSAVLCFDSTHLKFKQINTSTNSYINSGDS